MYHLFTSVILPLFFFFYPCKAHFSVNYPYWRGDSFETQWERPCGGVNQSISNTNRTMWPLEGGSISVHGSHPWNYMFVNLGIGGDNTTNFNITLMEGFNQTGNGTLCLPRVTIPEGTPVGDGTDASIQVIQVNEHGNSLYNCADITFSSNATILEDDRCMNSTGVGARPLSASETTTTEEDENENDTCPTATAASASASATGGAAAAVAKSVMSTGPWSYVIVSLVLGVTWWL